MSWALGVEDYEEIAAEIDGLLRQEIPDTLSGKLRMLGPLRRLAAAPPRRTARGMSYSLAMKRT